MFTYAYRLTVLNGKRLPLVSLRSLQAQRSTCGGRPERAPEQVMEAGRAASRGGEKPGATFCQILNLASK
ncbi:MAG: hypothetical protein CMQ20_02520 [Gammaproteobacteria bacterium]|nr:hypothetical protein [Gammaproteobacteria bacterium]